MMHAFPYGMDAWFPVVRGLDAPSLFLDAMDARTPRRLGEAWAALPDGGRIVLQSVASPGQKPDLARLEGELGATGHVERFLIFPGTGGSFTLLPKMDGAALRGGIPLLPGGRARGRALWALLKAASPLGVADRLGRPEIAVWTKGKPEPEAESLAVLPVAGSIAVAAGVPGQNQKIIIRALDRRGDARAILKIGFSERTDDAVAREARALEKVAAILDDRAPKLLAEGRRAGRTWHAQEPLPGRHAGDEFLPQHGEFLAELGGKTRETALLMELRAFQDSLQNLSQLAPETDPDWHREYQGLADAILATAGDSEFPTTFAHGDFTPWNLVSKRGCLRAYDWEYFSEGAPALHDLFHFHIQGSILVKRISGERIFDGLDAFFRGPAGDVVRALGIRAEELLQSLALYILHEAVLQEVQERRSPSPFAQATWLRHARRALCRRLTGLLTERRLPTWATATGVPDREAPRNAA